MGAVCCNTKNQDNTRGGKISNFEESGHTFSGKDTQNRESRGNTCGGKDIKVEDDDLTLYSSTYQMNVNDSMHLDYAKLLQNKK